MSNGVPDKINPGDYYTPDPQPDRPPGTPPPDQDEGYEGPSFPSFATYAYYQGLSRDERQYGEEAEYRQQFYNFVEQLHQQVYDAVVNGDEIISSCLLYTSPSPRDLSTSRMPSSA